MGITLDFELFVIDNKSLMIECYTLLYEILVNTVQFSVKMFRIDS